MFFPQIIAIRRSNAAQVKSLGRLRTEKTAFECEFPSVVSANFTYAADFAIYERKRERAGTTWHHGISDTDALQAYLLPPPRFVLLVVGGRKTRRRIHCLMLFYPV